METWKIVLLVIGCVAAWSAVMLALFTFNSFIFRKLSGWDRAREAYGIDREVYESTIPRQSAGFALLAYAKNSIHIGLKAEGLQISAMFLFKHFVKPVLVPWEDVTVGTWTNILGESMSVTFSKAPGVRIGFSPKATRNILTHIEGLSSEERHPGLVKLRDGYAELLEAGSNPASQSLHC